jgi:hypothetical protein
VFHKPPNLPLFSDLLLIQIHKLPTKGAPPKLQIHPIADIKGLPKSSPDARLKRRVVRMIAGVDGLGHVVGEDCALAVDLHPALVEGLFAAVDDEGLDGQAAGVGVLDHAGLEGLALGALVLAVGLGVDQNIRAE